MCKWKNPSRRHPCEDPHFSVDAAYAVKYSAVGWEKTRKNQGLLVAMVIILPPRLLGIPGSKWAFSILFAYGIYSSLLPATKSAEFLAKTFCVPGFLELAMDILGKNLQSFGWNGLQQAGSASFFGGQVPSWPTARNMNVKEQNVSLIRTKHAREMNLNIHMLFVCFCFIVTWFFGKFRHVRAILYYKVGPLRSL